MTRTQQARVRRAAKWAGVVVCVLMAAAWVVSVWWTFGRVGVRAGNHYRAVGVDGGCIVIGYNDMQNVSRWFFEPPRDRGMVWWPASTSSVDFWFYWVPLWIPFALVALPTAWLCWRDRRRARPGHCPCGYSLAGLAPGAPCPECGKASA